MPWLSRNYLGKFCFFSCCFWLLAIHRGIELLANVMDDNVNLVLVLSTKRSFIR